MDQPKLHPNLTARACASTYAIMGGIWLILLAAVLPSALRGVKVAAQMAVVVAGVLVFVLVWAASFRMWISGNTLSYRSLLAGHIRFS